MYQLFNGITYVIGGKGSENIRSMEYPKKSFFYIIILNVDSLTIIQLKLSKLCEAILDIIMEGTVYHIFYFGPSFYFL